MNRQHLHFTTRTLAFSALSISRFPTAVHVSASNFILQHPFVGI